jgi:tRNA 2-thiouridine synthesizing protein A
MNDPIMPKTCTSDAALDTSGLNCPLPVLKTKKALAALRGGQRLHVIATDPGSQIDIPAFAAQTGHALAEEWREGDRFHFVLCKRPDGPG